MLTASAACLAAWIWLRTGRSPASLAITALIHFRASARWVGREAWPAVRGVAYRYRESVEAVRREM